MMGPRLLAASIRMQGTTRDCLIAQIAGVVPASCAAGFKSLATGMLPVVTLELPAPDRAVRAVVMTCSCDFT